MGYTGRDMGINEKTYDNHQDGCYDSHYTVDSKGNVKITVVVNTEQLATHRVRETVFGAVDEFIDVLNEVQSVICLSPDVVDPRSPLDE